MKLLIEVERIGDSTMYSEPYHPAPQTFDPIIAFNTINDVLIWFEDHYTATYDLRHRENDTMLIITRKNWREEVIGRAYFLIIDVVAGQSIITDEIEELW